MIINSIDPVLLTLGPLEIRYYGLIYALGFIIAYLFLGRFIKKGKIHGLDKKGLDDLILYLIIGIVAGARLFYVIFYSPKTYLSSPLDIFMIWKGGLAFHGGLIGAVVAAYLFSKKNRINMMELFDALCIPASLALALGRIANFTNHELYGYVTNLPWCVVFTGIEGCRHPYQIYAFLTHIITFLALLFIYKKQKKQGLTFWSFILLYAAFRFITDFFKVETKIFYLGIGQWASIMMLIIGFHFINKYRKKGISRSQPLEQG